MLKLKPLHSLLIHAHHDVPGKTMLMGLKRIISTKDDTLVVLGLECVHDIVDCINKKEESKEIMNTDLTGIGSCNLYLYE